MFWLLACTAPADGWKLPPGRDPAAIPDDTGEDTAVDTAIDPEDSTPPDSPDDSPPPDDTGLPTGHVVIGFWCGPPASEMTAARMAEIAAAGFTTVSNACDSTTYTTSYNQLMLSLAAAEGLDAVVTDSRGIAAGTGVDIANNAAAIVADYASYPALRAYHVYDEPSTAAFATLASAADEIAARDPSHFTSINLLPDYASTGQLGVSTYDEYAQSFVATVGPAFFTYDHYNFLSDGTDGPTFFSNLASIRAAAGHTPWGQYIQSISYSGHRATTGAEKRWAALHTLAYGGTGVMYFTYWTPPQTSEAFGDGILDANGNETSQYPDVASINRSVAAIGRYLAAATTTDVYHHGTLAAGTRARSPGDLVYVPSAAQITVGTFAIGTGAYALLVNRDHVNMADTDVYVGTTDGVVQQLDVNSGSFPNAATTTDSIGTRLHVTLAAGDGLLLYIPAPAAGPVGAEAWFGSVRSDAGTLDIVDARFGTTQIAAAGWDSCPTGATSIGRDFQSNGFWLCAPDAYAGRTYYVGNVVGDAGNLYQIAGGVTTWLGAGGWDTCPAGSLIGHRFDSNGFWVCVV